MSPAKGNSWSFSDGPPAPSKRKLTVRWNSKFTDMVYWNILTTRALPLSRGSSQWGWVNVTGAYKKWDLPSPTSQPRFSACSENNKHFICWSICTAKFIFAFSPVHSVDRFKSFPTVYDNPMTEAISIYWLNVSTEMGVPVRVLARNLHDGIPHLPVTSQGREFLLDFPWDSPNVISMERKMAAARCKCFHFSTNIRMLFHKYCRYDPANSFPLTFTTMTAGLKSLSPEITLEVG